MNRAAQRRLDERERRRSEIVDAADALAAERGWDSVTMDGVARQARLSRALVYLYFRDKTDLHATLCERAKTDLLHRFEAAIADSAGRHPIEAIGRAYVRFAQEQPHYFEALSRFEATPEDPAGESALGGQIALHRLLVEVLERGRERGELHADCGDSGLTAVALWGFTHGLIQISTTKRTLLERQGIGQEALLEQAFTLLGRALGLPD